MATGNPYLDAAQQTTAGNVQQAQAATAANRINQVTPYGSLNYTQGVDANGNPTWTANQQLSQPLQQLTNTSLAGLQASQANPMYGINPGQTYSDAIMQRLQPQQAQAQEMNTAALANQGIVPGTAAYENAMRTFNQGQNDQRTSAIVGGMNTGLQAQQLQNQTAANIKSLASPNYVNPYTQATVAGPDYLGAYSTQNAQAIAAQNAANARTANTQSGLYGLGSAALMGSGVGGLASGLGNAASGIGNLVSGVGSGLSGINNWWNNLNFGNSGMGEGMVNGGVTGNTYDAFGNLASTGNAAPAAADWASAFGGTGGMDYSDIRMKENISLIGQLPSGLNVYNFEYKPKFKDLAGHGAFTGVMAQEVEKVIPKAVVTMPNGYKAVNYSLIN